MSAGVVGFAEYQTPRLNRFFSLQQRDIGRMTSTAIESLPPPRCLSQARTRLSRPLMARKGQSRDQTSLRLLLGRQTCQEQTRFHGRGTMRKNWGDSFVV